MAISRRCGSHQFLENLWMSRERSSRANCSSSSSPEDLGLAFQPVKAQGLGGRVRDD